MPKNLSSIIIYFVVFSLLSCLLYCIIKLATEINSLSVILRLIVRFHHL